jgi:HPt (histidine-containing phosphotransfer) domain-containing protein
MRILLLEGDEQTATVVCNADTKEQKMRALVARIWERAKPKVLEQLSYVEIATQALFTAVLDESTQKKAEQQAHKLAGSLGTFGLLQGSELAKQIETIFQSDVAIVHQQMHYLKELVVDLHLLVEQTTAASLQSVNRPK